MDGLSQFAALPSVKDGSGPLQMRWTRAFVVPAAVGLSKGLLRLSVGRRRSTLGSATAQQQTRVATQAGRAARPDAGSHER